MPDSGGLISVRSLRGRVRPIDFTEMDAFKKNKDKRADKRNKVISQKTFKGLLFL